MLHCSSFENHALTSVILPVTLVPMMRGRGISSGRSLQFDTSVSFLCCSSRIFCRFCLSAVRSSAKNADEHLEGTKEHSNVTPVLFVLTHQVHKETVPNTYVKITAYRRGFPINLLIVPHSTLVSFLVFRLGKVSLRHRQNSLSPSKRGLEEREATVTVIITNLLLTNVIS